MSAAPEFSIVIENPSPETPTDGEDAPQTTTHEVNHSTCSTMGSNVVCCKLE